ncbi:patatin-like phospholipase family protein [Ancylobacter pratisalsi]|uniref:Patatin-like phospholipase family protein n=1 Tax=Ancylobacter pratisalsi TaxID=1745854 RepID=A0A6P1YHG1_9HYPH|nr:patatin-like phospholipase family protein [Ancylobacter pratisalsi]QIB32582.1 patatin-like phospholipase family protein [Ancylobacter pratisalsi]
MFKRRDFLIASAAGALLHPTAAALAQSGAAGDTPAPASGTQAGAGAWDDGLAHPIPYTPPLGTGKERGLVLGGGGAYLASWMVGYFKSLHKAGVDLATADIVVGTSAGSFLGAALTGGHMWRFGSELSFFGEFPSLFAKLIPTMAPNESQLRARHLATTAVEADPATIQGIGRAAMAARNAAGPDSYPTAVERLIGETAWPSPALYTTANDCYTGERLIVSPLSGIEVNHACAASSSLPGSMGPTWLGNRLCMDGGICQTSTHCDVVAGVKKALVISLTDGSAGAAKVGLRTSSLPNTLQQEVADLKAGGTDVVLKVVGLLPGVTHVDSIMDPKWIAPCIANGEERGHADAAEMKAFWN